MEICRRYLGAIVNKSEESNIETLTDDLSTQISEENLSLMKTFPRNCKSDSVN